MARSTSWVSNERSTSGMANFTYDGSYIRRSSPFVHGHRCDYIVSGDRKTVCYRASSVTPPTSTSRIKQPNVADAAGWSDESPNERNYDGGTFRNDEESPLSSYNHVFYGYDEEPSLARDAVKKSMPPEKSMLMTSDDCQLEKIQPQNIFHFLYGDVSGCNNALTPETPFAVTPAEVSPASAAKWDMLDGHVSRHNAELAFIKPCMDIPKDYMEPQMTQLVTSSAEKKGQQNPIRSPVRSLFGAMRSLRSRLANKSRDRSCMSDVSASKTHLGDVSLKERLRNRSCSSANERMESTTERSSKGCNLKSPTARVDESAADLFKGVVAEATVNTEMSLPKDQTEGDIPPIAIPQTILKKLCKDDDATTNKLNVHLPETLDSYTMKVETEFPNRLYLQRYQKRKQFRSYHMPFEQHYLGASDKVALGGNRSDGISPMVQRLSVQVPRLHVLQDDGKVDLPSLPTPEDRSNKALASEMISKTKEVRRVGDTKDEIDRMPSNMELSRLITYMSIHSTEADFVNHMSTVINEIDEALDDANSDDDIDRMKQLPDKPGITDDALDHQRYTKQEHETTKSPLASANAGNYSGCNYADNAYLSLHGAYRDKKDAEHHIDRGERTHVAADARKATGDRMPGVIAPKADFLKPTTVLNELLSDAPASAPSSSHYVAASDVAIQDEHKSKEARKQPDLKPKNYDRKTGKAGAKTLSPKDGPEGNIGSLDTGLGSPLREADIHQRNEIITIGLEPLPVLRVDISRISEPIKILQRKTMSNKDMIHDMLMEDTDIPQPPQRTVIEKPSSSNIPAGDSAGTTVVPPQAALKPSMTIKSSHESSFGSLKDAAPAEFIETVPSIRSAQSSLVYDRGDVLSFYNYGSLASAEGRRQIKDETKSKASETVTSRRSVISAHAEPRAPISAAPSLKHPSRDLSIEILKPSTEIMETDSQIVGSKAASQRSLPLEQPDPPTREATTETPIKLTSFAPHRRAKTLSALGVSGPENIPTYSRGHMTDLFGTRLHSSRISQMDDIKGSLLRPVEISDASVPHMKKQGTNQQDILDTSSRAAVSRMGSAVPSTAGEPVEQLPDATKSIVKSKSTRSLTHDDTGSKMDAITAVGDDHTGHKTPSEEKTMVDYQTLQVAEHPRSLEGSVHTVSESAHEEVHAIKSTEEALDHDEMPKKQVTTSITDELSRDIASGAVPLPAMDVMHKAEDGDDLQQRTDQLLDENILQESMKVSREASMKVSREASMKVSREASMKVSRQGSIMETKKEETTVIKSESAHLGEHKLDPEQSMYDEQKQTTMLEETEDEVLAVVPPPEQTSGGSVEEKLKDEQHLKPESPGDPDPQQEIMGTTSLRSVPSQEPTTVGTEEHAIDATTSGVQQSEALPDPKHGTDSGTIAAEGSKNEKKKKKKKQRRKAMVVAKDRPRPLRHLVDNQLKEGFVATVYVVTSKKNATSSLCKVRFDYDNDRLIFETSTNTFDIDGSKVVAEEIPTLPGAPVLLKMTVIGKNASAIVIQSTNERNLNLLGGTIGWADASVKVKKGDRAASDHSDTDDESKSSIKMNGDYITSSRQRASRDELSQDFGFPGLGESSRSRMPSAKSRNQSGTLGLTEKGGAHSNGISYGEDNNEKQASDDPGTKKHGFLSRLLLRRRLSKN